MTESRISQLLDVLGRLEPDPVLELFAPDARILTVDGRRAHGTEAIRDLLTEFLGTLRSTTYLVTAEWHQDNTWIAEVEASYELQDWLRLSKLPRAFVLRDGPEGISDLRVYGAHERSLADHRTGEEGMWIGDRWIPPL